MQMPGRVFSSGSYRYGFNGKENDNDVKGTGNSLDFGARIYDSRLGRWLSTDPLQSKYPYLSPYNFVANSPINAIDPDGRLIIFINGLWGPPNKVGQGATIDYWGERWVKNAQEAIGDYKPPMFIDGSLGGTNAIPTNLRANDRIQIGGNAAFFSAKTIIENLKDGETIKIITNSMGAAFERGFTEGLLAYRNERLSTINTSISEIMLEKIGISTLISADRRKELDKSILVKANTDLEIKYQQLVQELYGLKSEKKKLLNLTIEMVIDLSPHQINYADPNAQSNYYMTAGQENMNPAERKFVDEKSIEGAKNLGKMTSHHSSGADPLKLPSSKNRDSKNK